MRQDQEADIRRRVNPVYADQIGTESYERKLLLDEIDRLRAEVALLKFRLAESGALDPIEGRTLASIPYSMIDEFPKRD